MIFGSDPMTIKKAAQAIRNGELVAFPTETVYGLGADAMNADAVEKIFKAKGRPADNPLIVHISDMEMFEQVCYPNETAIKLAERFWPGPLTIILPKKDIIPSVVTAGMDSVAVRFPSHRIAKKLISMSGRPIAAPSANRSGRPSPTLAKHVLDDYGEDNEEIAVLLDGGKCKCGLESTIVSLLSDEPVILRPGLITYEQLKKIVPNVKIASGVKNKPKENERPLSPGMVHRHYAPKAFTIGVMGPTQKAAAYINKEIMATGKYCCVMCFDDESDLFVSEAKVFSYGKNGNSKKAAASVFSTLREIDQLDPDTIYIHLSDESGIGLAVYNRLIRTCGFNIVDTASMPMVVGMTGKTGSGKTTVSRELEKMGYFHIDTDLISKRTLDKGKEELCKRFGESILDPNGTINRKKLAQSAFSSEEDRLCLNKITHRYIMEEVVKILDKNEKTGTPSIIDGAVLVEAQADKLCDLLVEVVADASVRRSRILQRDGITEEQADLRLNTHYFDVDAGFVFHNNDQKEFDKSLSELKRLLKGDSKK